MGCHLFTDSEILTEEQRCPGHWAAYSRSEVDSPAESSPSSARGGWCRQASTLVDTALIQRAPGNLTQDRGHESAWVAGQGGLVGSSARDKVVGPWEIQKSGATFLRN